MVMVSVDEFVALCFVLFNCTDEYGACGKAGLQLWWIVWCINCIV